ncbi:MAG: hypothetical protein EAZ32_12955 [Cytophagia bacterium]|nr:MAG: hypothetical protein EAZ46_07785 [Runella sp.]TAG18713.1 MAG: hypothetical protein EAZ38_14030 [Cytophagales bacterium]TAG38278.1 MAG: hypothetical protein EAZ32_12955 [Cytophagia bacterium]TAG50454.1 MAG: hypothetical protein EAZ29_12485 [Runella slithyformis]TAG79657.1 MAG: hypothetical protein EAZ22_11010 [Cytophagales bacterium]
MKDAKKLVFKFSELGYNAEAKVLTASDYGSPQLRKRIFIIRIKQKTEFLNSPSQFILLI